MADSHAAHRLQQRGGPLDKTASLTTVQSSATRKRTSLDETVLRPPSAASKTLSPHRPTPGKNARTGTVDIKSPMKQGHAASQTLGPSPCDRSSPPKLPPKTLRQHKSSPLPFPPEKAAAGTAENDSQPPSLPARGRTQRSDSESTQSTERRPSQLMVASSGLKEGQQPALPMRRQNLAHSPMGGRSPNVPRKLSESEIAATFRRPNQLMVASNSMEESQLLGSPLRRQSSPNCPIPARSPGAPPKILSDYEDEASSGAEDGNHGRRGGTMRRKVTRRACRVNSRRTKRNGGSNAHNLQFIRSMTTSGTIPIELKSARNRLATLSRLSSSDRLHGYVGLTKIKAELTNYKQGAELPLQGDEDGERELRRLRNKQTLKLIRKEIKFVHRLRHCVERYVKPLKNQSRVDTDTLFGHVEAVFAVAERLLVKLKDTAPRGRDDVAGCVGKCFKELNEEMKVVYRKYCALYDNSSKLLAHLAEEQWFREKLHRLGSKDNGAAIYELQSLLEKPLIHMATYPIRLKTLKNFTEDDHPDFVPLQEAIVLWEDLNFATCHAWRLKLSANATTPVTANSQHGEEARPYLSLDEACQPPTSTN